MRKHPCWRCKAPITESTCPACGGLNTIVAHRHWVSYVVTFVVALIVICLGVVLFGAEIEAPATLPPDTPGVVIARDVLAVTIVPKAGTTLTPVDGIPPAGMVVYTFSAPVGRYTLVGIIGITDGLVDQIEFKIVVGEPPDPPNPPDPPTPPGPVAKLRVLVVEEKQSKQRAQYYAALHSPTVRKWLESNGHTIEWRDKDDVDAAGKPVVPEGAVPCVYFYDDSGKELWKGMPVDAEGKVIEAAFMALVQKWGKVK